MPCFAHNARARKLARNPLRYDPTRTTLIRRKFEAEVKARFALLKKAVVAFLVQSDALGLKDEQKPVTHGGPGSGNFGHAGRPGQVGGSAPGDGGGSSSVSVPSAPSGSSIARVKSSGPDYADSDHAAAIIDQWATEATGSRTGEYEKIRKEGEAWVGGAKNKGWQDLYTETQSRLADQGITQMTIYRGIRVPVDHPLAKAIAAGKMKAGSSFNATGDSLTSWSLSYGVGSKFASAMEGLARGTATGYVGVVIRREVPASDVVGSHQTHKGLLDSEQEIIAKYRGSAKLTIVSVHS